MVTLYVNEQAWFDDYDANEGLLLHLYMGYVENDWYMTKVMLCIAWKEWIS